MRLFPGDNICVLRIFFIVTWILFLLPHPKQTHTFRFAYTAVSLNLFRGYEIDKIN